MIKSYLPGNDIIMKNATKGQLLKARDIECLLDKQTQVILSAVDERMQKSDEKVNAKMEKLINTLDGFLKKTTALEDEFEMMKMDMNRVKQVIRTKLGVKLD